MTVVVALALSTVLAARGGQAKTHGKESVRIYVVAAEVPGGSPPGDALQGRLAAVRELREALRRKAGLRVVDDRAQADVTVEVTDREQQSAGEGGFGGVKLTPFVNTIIRVRVTFGEHQKRIEGDGARHRIARGEGCCGRLAEVDRAQSRGPALLTGLQPLRRDLHLPDYQLTRLPTYPITNLPNYQITNFRYGFRPSGSVSLFTFSGAASCAVPMFQGGIGALPGG